MRTDTEGRREEGRLKDLETRMNISARTRARAPATVKWPSTECPPSYIALFRNFSKAYDGIGMSCGCGWA